MGRTQKDSESILNKGVQKVDLSDEVVNQIDQSTSAISALQDQIGSTTPVTIYTNLVLDYGYINIVCDGTDIEITLPNPAETGGTGHTFNISNINVSKVTLIGTISGQTNIKLHQWEVTTFFSDGSIWIMK